MRQLDDAGNVYLSEKGDMIVFDSTLTKASEDYGTEVTVAVKSDRNGAKIFTWGNKNDLPNRREALIAANSIVPELLKTKRDITVGAGLYAYKTIFKDGKATNEEVEMPAIIAEWLENVDYIYYLMAAAKSLYLHANIFTEFVWDRQHKNIVSIMAHECRHIRAEVKNDKGKIPAYYYSPEWIVAKGSRKRSDNIERIPSYERFFDKEKIPQPKFIVHAGDDLLTDDYYYTPSWWGGATWIEVANTIPSFHKNNIRNGYSIRFHIEYPSDYFGDTGSHAVNTGDVKKAKEKYESMKQRFLDHMNKWLAGDDNAGRSLFSSYEINRQMGKDFPGIKVTPLNVDLKDKALLELFEKSNQANISAQGIHPTLANIETAGKLSSGTEIRNAFYMYLLIKTPTPRNILLEPFNLVKKINKWPTEIKLGFKDVVMTALSDDKTGKKESEPNTTSE